MRAEYRITRARGGGVYVHGTDGTGGWYPSQAAAVADIERVSGPRERIEPAGVARAARRAEAVRVPVRGARHFGGEDPAFTEPGAERRGWSDPLESWHRPLSLPLGGVRLA